MSYEIMLHPQVVKFLKILPKEIAERIKIKLKEIKNEPFKFLEHYEGEDVYKLRIGEYRALIDVDFSKRVLYVQELDHRNRIYKR